VDHVPVSFDIFFQAFAHGDPVDADEPAATAVLVPWVSGEEPDYKFVRVETSDGGADVYGYGTANSLMINHAAGRAIWDLMFDVAKAGGYVVLPVGCPTCVTRPEQVDDLPEELRADVVVVHSGDDLLRVVETA
jgi:hypothetical protein